MFETLIQYNNIDISLFLLRLAIGSIFLYHAFPKLKNPGAMGQVMGISAMIPLVLGSVELLSALAVIFGVYTEIGALLLGIVMVGAIGMKIMKWNIPFSATDKTGWEFDLILLVANVAILLSGGGSIG